MFLWIVSFHKCIGLYTENISSIYELQTRFDFVWWKRDKLLQLILLYAAVLDMQ